jgi:protein-tyrosine phosphatase
MHFVDLHSHVLPALDDGVRTLEESLELCGLLEKMGFDTVCATPHQKQGQFLPELSAIDAAYAQVKGALAAAGRGITLNLGAENFWDEVFLGRVPKKSQPTYTGGRAFLCEIHTRLLPARFEDALFQIRVSGLLPVLAHPERYAPLWQDFDRYAALGRTCALVVDLGALDGAHGREECKMARRLVEEDLAHAAASDVHSPADARAAGAGIAFIRKRKGDAGVKRLLDMNPRRILAGELPD